MIDNTKRGRKEIKLWDGKAPDPKKIEEVKKMPLAKQLDYGYYNIKK